MQEDTTLPLLVDVLRKHPRATDAEMIGPFVRVVEGPSDLAIPTARISRQPILLQREDQ
jgi:hypothetical protein